MTEEAAVIEANEAFYRAFAAGDVAALERCFARRAPLATAHPWRPSVHGRSAVLEGWRAILGDPPPIRPVQPQVALLGDGDGDAARDGASAIVTCLEDLGADPCVATNVFVREDGEWRICHHHGAPLAAVFAEPPADGEPVH